MNIIESPAGKIITTSQGYDTFLPHNLPPQINWNNALVSSLSRADFLLGKLAREGSKLLNPHLFMRPFLTREAVLSSRIEGTHSTLDELLAVDAGVHVNQNPDDIQEVQNYMNALDYGLDRLQELPVSLRLIKEIHHELMQGVRGSQAKPGEFRTVQNWIGLAGCTVQTAKFVPPSPEHLMHCLGSFESFLHNRELPPLVHIALCHYQFEAIHPFLDGNGRMGRLLIILLLIEHKMLPSPLLYVSAFFEATRQEYYQHLYNVSAAGTWSDWLMYFLNAVASQSEDTLSRAERINDLLNEWKLKVAQSSSSVPVELVEHLAVNPYCTIKKIASDLKVAYTTAQRAIEKLEIAGILTQTNDNKRDKVYCAREILNILEEPTKINIDTA